MTVLFVKQFNVAGASIFDFVLFCFVLSFVLLSLFFFEVVCVLFIEPYWLTPNFFHHILNLSYFRWPSAAAASYDTNVAIESPLRHRTSPFFCGRPKCVIGCVSRLKTQIGVDKQRQLLRAIVLTHPVDGFDEVANYIKWYAVASDPH